MAYDVMTITIKGAQVFSQLAGDPNEHLVIDGCDADADVKTQAQAVNVSVRPTMSVSGTTNIVLSGVTDSSFFVYAQFKAGEVTGVGGQVNSFYLYGHLVSDPNTKFVIAVASDSRSTKLPESQDIINYVEIRFALTFAPIQSTAQISIPTDNFYVSRSEYLHDMDSLVRDIDSLEGRVVTTHSVGTPTVGEDQIIYGNKTFKNDINIGSLNYHPTTNMVETATGNSLSVTYKNISTTPIIRLNYWEDGGVVTSTDTFIGCSSQTPGGSASISIGYQNVTSSDDKYNISISVPGKTRYDLNNSIRLDRDGIVVYSPSIKMTGDIKLMGVNDSNSNIHIKESNGALLLENTFDTDTEVISESDSYSSFSLFNGYENNGLVTKVSLFSSNYKDSTDNYSNISVNTVFYDHGADSAKDQSILLNTKLGDTTAGILIKSGTETTNNATNTSSIINLDASRVSVKGSLYIENNIMPSNDAPGDVCLGDANYPFEEVYAKRFFGATPYPETPTDLPLGAQSFFTATYTSSEQNPIQRGDWLKPDPDHAGKWLVSRAFGLVRRNVVTDVTLAFSNHIGNMQENISSTTGYTIAAVSSSTIFLGQRVL